MYLRSFILCFLISLFLFCKTNKKEQKTISDSEGWHYNKNENGQSEKFFAIGAWHVPSFTSSEDKHVDRSTDAELFKSQARNLNIVLTHHRSFESFMSEEDRIIMTVNPAEFLRSYLNKIPSLSNKGKEGGYYKSQY